MVKRAVHGGRAAADNEVPQKRPRIDLRRSQINFIQPFRNVELDHADAVWVSSLGLTRLLNLMSDGVNLVERNALFKEFVQEFRAVNTEPPLRYVTTIQSGTSRREINVDAELLASKFDIPHNYPSGTQLGGGRESQWREGFKVFENDGSTYNRKKGWRLENLRPDYKHFKRRYELLHRLIWFAKRHDYVGNGQARAIHGVREPKDSQQQPDWATTLLCNLAQEILNLQKNPMKGCRGDKITLIGPIIRHILDTLDDKENNSEQVSDEGGDSGGAATHVDRGRSESDRIGVTSSRDNDQNSDSDKGGDDCGGAAANLDSGQSELDKNDVTMSRDDELASDKGGDHGGAETQMDSEQGELERNRGTVCRDNEQASDTGDDHDGAATHLDSGQGELDRNGATVRRDVAEAADLDGRKDSDRSDVCPFPATLPTPPPLDNHLLGDSEVPRADAAATTGFQLNKDTIGRAGGTLIQDASVIKRDETSCPGCKLIRYHLTSLSTSAEMLATSPYPATRILRIITEHLSFLDDTFMEVDFCEECERPYNGDQVQVCKSVLTLLDQHISSSGSSAAVHPIDRDDSDILFDAGFWENVAEAYWRLESVVDGALTKYMSRRGGGTLSNILKLGLGETSPKATSYCISTLAELGPYVHVSEFPDLLAVALPLLKTDNEYYDVGSTVGAAMQLLAAIMVRDDDFLQQIANRYPGLTSFWDSFDYLFRSSRRVVADRYLTVDVVTLLIKRLAVLQQSNFKDLLLFQELILATTLVLDSKKVARITSSLHRCPYLSFAQASARLQLKDYGLAMENLETVIRGDARSELKAVDQLPDSEEDVSEGHVLPRRRITFQELRANVLLPPVKLQAYRGMTFLKTILGDLDGALNTIVLEERLQMEIAAGRDSQIAGISVGQYFQYDAVLEKSVILGLQCRLEESLAALKHQKRSYQNLHFSLAHKAYIYFMMGEKLEASRYIQQAVEKRLALKRKGLWGDMNWLHPQLSYLPMSYKALVHLTRMALAMSTYPQDSSYCVSTRSRQGSAALIGQEERSLRREEEDAAIPVHSQTGFMRHNQAPGAELWFKQISCEPRGNEQGSRGFNYENLALIDFLKDGVHLGTEHLLKLYKLAPCLIRISNYCHLSAAINGNFEPVLSSDLNSLSYEHLRMFIKNYPEVSCYLGKLGLEPCHDPMHLCSTLGNFDLASDEQLLEDIGRCTNLADKDLGLSMTLATQTTVGQNLIHRSVSNSGDVYTNLEGR